MPVSSSLRWQASGQCVISLENIVQMWLIFNKLLSTHLALVSIMNSKMCLQVTLPAWKDLSVQKAWNTCLIGNSEEAAKPLSICLNEVCSPLQSPELSSHTLLFKLCYMVQLDSKETKQNYKTLQIMLIWYLKLWKTHLGNKSHRRLGTIWPRDLEMVEANLLKPQILCWGNWSAFQLPHSWKPNHQKHSHLERVI